MLGYTYIKYRKRLRRHTKSLQQRCQGSRDTVRETGGYCSRNRWRGGNGVFLQAISGANETLRQYAEAIFTVAGVISLEKPVEVG